MPLKIVYLDNEPQLCEMFVDNFASADVSVETFTDPEKAVAAINATIPDLVFLDYRLPQTTGEAVAHRLMADIPKVLVTGDLTVKGIKDFVKIFHKPFNFDEMEEFIRNSMDRKKAA